MSAQRPLLETVEVNSTPRVGPQISHGRGTSTETPPPPLPPVSPAAGTGSGSSSSPTSTLNSMRDKTSSFFSSWSAPKHRSPKSAIKVLEMCLSTSPKPPLPSMIQVIIDVSRRENGQTTVSDSVQGQNGWLVTQLQQRAQRAENELVLAKIMMLTHDLLVYGASEFGNALSPVADVFFHPEILLSAIRPRRTGNAQGPSGGSPTTSTVSTSAFPWNTTGSSGQRTVDFAAYEEATRFLIAYNHSLLQFQLRHWRYGNLMDPQCPDLLLRVEEYDNAYMSRMRDLFLNCVALTKFLVLADTSNVPCRCYVFAEVLRRYVADTKRLYHVMNQMQHIEMLVTNNTGAMRIEDVRRSFEVGNHFIRLTDQLNEFYDALRMLPDDGLFEKNLLPDRLQQFSKEVLDLIDEYLAKYEALELIDVQPLHEVLANTTASPSDGAAPTAAVPTHSGVDNPQNQNSGAPFEQSSPPSGGIAPVEDHRPRHPPPPDAPKLRGCIPARNSFDTADSFENEAGGASQPPHNLVHPNLPQHWSFGVNRSGVGSISSSEDAILNPQRRIDASKFDLIEDTAMLTSLGGRASDGVNMANIEGNVEATRLMATVERFEVLTDQVLGRGGFGVVYKAWDHNEGRHVACKEVKLADQNNKSGIHELYQEYRFLTALDHPNIVKVLSFAVHHGHGRIFMEWVPSGSVQAVLQDTKKKGLKEPIVRRYIREALQGLAYLHSRGIVHRDVKPGNMLLSSEGAVKLTDFGTSRTLEHAGETVQTGTVVGTVPYLAPECVRGTYSAASDVWALGCTALHMISGKVPWADEARDSVSLIFMLGNLTSLPRAVQEVEMSDELRSFISTAMTFDRYQRPTVDVLLQNGYFID